MELLAIFEAAKLHYDGAVKAAAKPGGFIYGWQNLLLNESQVATTVSFHELDLANKALELVINQTGVSELKEKIRVILLQIRDEWTRLNRL